MSISEIVTPIFFPPQQLLSLWICEEKELVHEIAGLGELKSPWHSCQMSWLENHLNIINTYSQALEALDNYKGKCAHLDNLIFQLFVYNFQIKCTAYTSQTHFGFKNSNMGSKMHIFKVISILPNSQKWRQQKMKMNPKIAK